MTNKQIEEKALVAYPEYWLNPVIDGNIDKREGYIKALKEIESLPKIKGWVAREKDSTISFFNKKPQRFIDENNNCTGWYSEDGCETAINFDSDIPELTWESEPIEVELLIRKI